MRRVKIFQSSSPTQLETQINQWLEGNSQVIIINMFQSLASASTTKSYRIDNNYLYTILFEQP